MHQFDVLRNPTPSTAGWTPFLLVLQADLLQDLATAVVAPLVLESEFGRPASILNPVFEIAGVRLVLSTAELAGVSRTALGERIGSLAEHRNEVVQALDLLFTGV